MGFRKSSYFGERLVDRIVLVGAGLMQVTSKRPLENL